jgi:hypothetical protein
VLSATQGLPPNIAARYKDDVRVLNQEIAERRNALNELQRLAKYAKKAPKRRHAAPGGKKKTGGKKTTRKLLKSKPSFKAKPRAGKKRGFAKRK